MNRRICPVFLVVSVFVVSPPGMNAGVAYAQTDVEKAGDQPKAADTMPTLPYEGELIAEDVYVRAGPGSNYDPTTKLRSGDRVKVLGEQYGWLIIAPPAGSFSWIDAEMVDKTGPARGHIQPGVINADGARIRAGSSLHNHKREIQMTADKGLKVEIIGEADGMYKIMPPVGATLYITSEYVRRAPPRKADEGPMAPVRLPPAVQGSQTGPMTDVRGGNEPSTGEAVRDGNPAPAKDGLPAGPLATGDGGKTVRDGNHAPAGDAGKMVRDGNHAPAGTMVRDGNHAPAGDGNHAPAGAGSEQIGVMTADEAMNARLRSILPESEYASKLMEIEQRFRKIFTNRETRPTHEVLSALVTEYQPIAAQQQEPIAAAYANARVEQLRIRIELLDHRKRIESEDRDVAIFRQQLLEDRNRLRVAPPDVTMPDYDFRGELRRSLVFRGEKARFRLVDPEKNRTVAYIDAPDDEMENISRLVGQYVGVRAARRDFDVKLRVHMIVAGDIVPLDEASGMPVAKQLPVEADPDGAVAGEVKAEDAPN